MQDKKQLYRIGILGLVIIAGLFCSLSPAKTYAYTASMSTGDYIQLDVTSYNTGVSIKEDSINVVTDCRSGYNLTVSTPEGSDLYLYGAGSVVFTAVDGTSTLANSTNKWGYTLSSNPSSSTVFLPLSATPSTLKTPAQTASPSSDINDTFPISYGVKVSNSVASGEYYMSNAGAIVYYLTMDASCIEYTVHFFANGGTGTMADQGIPVEEPTHLNEVAFAAPTGASYTNANNTVINGSADKLWTFWGWNTNPDGTGDWYKNQEEVLDLAAVGGSINLYAQWKQATLADLLPGTQVGTEKVIDHDTMQDMTPEACWNSDKFTAIGTAYGQATLKDNRDGTTRTYTVAKLPDGLCWMTQNLNLGASTAITLTPYDTDITEDFSLPASNPSDFSTSSNQTNFNKATVLNNMTVPDYTVNTVYSGKVNAYYSFAAATADTNTYDKSAEVIVTTSICPKNWDLPTNTQYYNLRTKGNIATYNNTNSSYAGKNAGNEPYYFIYGGHRRGTGNTINTTSFNAPTTYGYLWTANNSSYRYGYGTYVYSSGLYNSTTGTTYYKYYGLSMRCVASNGTATINYDGNGDNDYPTQGTVGPQENVEINATTTLAGTGFTRNGWVFNGWNTSANGTGGTAVAANDPLSNLGLKPGETITLYAQWTPQATITYVNNCTQWLGTEGGCTSSISAGTQTQPINLNASGNGSGTLKTYNDFTTPASPYKIKEWTTEPNGGTAYNVSSTFQVTSGEPGGNITLYAHWVSTYTIIYDGNGADNASKGMGTTATSPKSVRQYNIAAGDPVTLLIPNFMKAGYGLAGWSADPDAWSHLNDNNESNDPIIYGPNETITAPTAEGTVLTLYAVWVPAEKDGSNNTVYLQDWDGCADLASASFDSTTGTITAGDIVALTDKRDNQVYTIARLADGKCWFVENLRLEHTYTKGQNINDSSVTNASLAEGYGVYSGSGNNNGYFDGLAEPEIANFSASTTANTLYYSGTQGSATIDIGINDTPAARFPRYHNKNTTEYLGNGNTDAPTFTENYGNPASPATSGTYKNANLYSNGNYYTFAAAMANTNYFSNSTSSEAADTSICPSGWTLPTSNGTSKDYGLLSQSYGGSGANQSTAGTGDVLSKRFRSFPNNFTYSGYYSSSSTSGRGTIGYYMSKSASSGGSINYLYFKSDNLSPSYSSSSYKYQGRSIRCVLDPCPAGSVCYNKNSDEAEGTMGRQAATDGGSVTLFASNYSRDGYGFAGWNTKADYSGTFYGPNETITVPTGTTANGLDLYAVWVESEDDLQGWTGCADLTRTEYDSTTGTFTSGLSSITALTDTRDGETYAVAKLADGNCWMIENLRISNVHGNNVTTTLTRANTNNPLNNGSTVTLKHLYSSSTTYNKLSASTSTAYSAQNPSGWCLSTWADCTDQTRLNTTNTASRTTHSGSSFTAGDHIYSYGNYYNWYAATAGNGVASMNDGDTVAGDICPTGWHLPYGGSGTGLNEGGTTGGFVYLDTQMGGTGTNVSDSATASNKWRTFPNNFLYSGNINGDYSNIAAFSGIGEGSFYATNMSTNSGVSIFDLHITSSSSEPIQTTFKATGATVRCVADRVTYTVQYDGNGADNASTGMGTTNGSTGIKSVAHTNVAPGDTFDLFASNFKRDGYGFVGWSTDANAWTKLTDNDATNDVRIWGPNELFTMPTPESSILTLYAIWAPAERDGSNNPVYLQNWSGCSSLDKTTYNSTTGKLEVGKNTITALTDKRDNMVYAVARLADGDCWIVENLRLSSAATSADYTNMTLSQGYAGKFTGLASSESSNFSNVTTSNSRYSTTDITGSNQGYRFPRYNETNKTPSTSPSLTQAVTTANAHVDFNDNIYSYGNYYSWAAAVANTNDYTSATKVDTSICPAGWDLPYSASNSEYKGSYAYLDTSMGGTGANQTSNLAASNKWRSFPNNFVYSGWYSSDATGGRGQSGYYWTSDVNTTSNSYHFRVGKNDINPTNSSYKYYGYTIRCTIKGCSAGNICYNENGNRVVGEMEDQTASDGASVTLSTSNYTRPSSRASYVAGFDVPGYGFAGWSDTPDYSGNLYGPNETITVPNGTSENGLNLYAIWIANNDFNSLQGYKKSYCESLTPAPANGTPTLASLAALDDVRDGQTYAIARLADGKCWMIENLRLESENTKGQNQFNSSITNESLAQGYFTASPSEDYGNFVGLADPEYANFSNSSTANSIYYNSNSGPNSGTVDINTTNDPGYRFPRYSNAEYTLDPGGDYYESTSGNGNYYSYASAMASTKYFATYADSDDDDTSICPTGWRLPYGGSRNIKFSYYGLASSLSATTNNSTSSNKLRKFPNNLVLAGVYDDDDISTLGTRGIYLTSSTVDSQPRYAYTLSITGNGLYPGTNQNNKFYGFSMRCVLESGDCPPGKICYQKNNSFASGTMGNQTAPADGGTVTLLGTNYSLDGYGFAGWSDVADYETNQNAHFYGPNATITVPTGTAANGLVLYAVWVESEGNMQSDTLASICDGLTPAPIDGTANLSSVTALTDQRDSRTYAIARLADGNCWMIENLRANTTTTTGDTKKAQSQGYASTSSYGSFTGLANSENANFSNSTTANSKYYSGTQSGSATVNIGTGSNPGYRFPRVNTSNIASRATKPVSNGAGGSSTSGGIYSFGNYYSWPAALANTAPYVGQNDVYGSSTSDSVNTSICPKNWRLPYGHWEGNGATSGGYSYLDIVLGGTGRYSDSSTNPTGATMSARWRSFPNNFILSGNFNGSSIVNRGSYGLYWTSTSSTSTTAYHMDFSENSVTPGTDESYKYHGMSIRCVSTANKCPAGSICYNKNAYKAGGADNVLGTMGNQTAAADGGTTTLLASNYSATGYGFAGWNTKPDYSGTFYGPNEDITVPTGTAANGLNLYAVWVASAGSLQNSTEVTSVCNSLTQVPANNVATLASVSALTDQRDNQTYAIAKLADGKCWMIENLRLNNTASHNSDGTLAQGYATSTTYGNFVGLATSESSNFSDSTTSNSLYTTSIIGSSDNPSSRMPRYNSTNTSSRAASPTSNNANIYSYGNYYTWSAALANTIYYISPTITDENGKTSETVNTSICPTGWRLPYGRSSGKGNTAGGFYYLNYRVNSLRSFPNNFIYSGRISASSISNRGSTGYYWTSTARNATSSYILQMTSSTVSPGTGTGGTKYYGASIRCVRSS